SPTVVRILGEPRLAAPLAQPEGESRCERVLHKGIVRGVVALRGTTVHHGIAGTALHVCAKSFVNDPMFTIESQSFLYTFARDALFLLRASNVHDILAQFLEFELLFFQPKFFGFQPDESHFGVQLRLTLETNRW